MERKARLRTVVLGLSVVVGYMGLVYWAGNTGSAGKYYESRIAMGRMK